MKPQELQAIKNLIVDSLAQSGNDLPYIRKMIALYDNVQKELDQVGDDD